MESWAISPKNYTVALVLGAIYEESNQLDSAVIYYNKAHNSITSNYDNNDTSIIINKVVIEMMLNKDIDFTSLEDDIDGFAIELLDMIKGKSRAELIDMLLQN